MVQVDIEHVPLALVFMQLPSVQWRSFGNRKPVALHGRHLFPCGPVQDAEQKVADVLMGARMIQTTPKHSQICNQDCTEPVHMKRLTVCKAANLVTSTEDKIDGGVDEVHITLSERVLSAKILVVHLAASSPARIPAICADDTAATDGKNFVVEVRAVPRLQDTTGAQLEGKAVGLDSDKGRAC